MKHLKKALLLTLVMCMAANGAHALGLFSSSRDTGMVQVTEEEYALIEKYGRLEEVLSIIDRMFLWDYEEDKLLEGAAQGMLGALGDDYTFYYTPDRMEQEKETQSGQYGGIGIEVFPNAKDDTITIKRVFYGGPSQQAGLKAADKIIGINGESFGAADINDAVAIMRGEIGEEITLSILREKEVFEVVVERALVNTQIISYEMLDDDIAYIRIYYFEGKLTEQFSEAISQFQDEGAKAIVLDLRENPGGLVDLAVEVVDVFVDQQLIFMTEDKYGRQLSQYGSEGAWDVPVAILVDRHSASASEIVAAALQEHGIARVIGEQTFGKGIMQSVYPFPKDGAGLQITSDYWLTPSGENLHEKGVMPNYKVTLNEDAIDDNYQIIREKDNQLERAIKVLQRILST